MSMDARRAHGNDRTTTTASQSTKQPFAGNEAITLDLNQECTEAGNAKRFVAHYGNRLRYVHGWGWMVWDGARWEMDESGQVMQLAKEMTEQLYWEAAHEPDYTRKQELWRHAKSSRSLRKLQAMVELATDERAVRRHVKDFDSNPFLLNVANGTLDLRVKPGEPGQLRPHDPNDHITKLAPVVYDPMARSWQWGRFLVSVFASDRAMIRYVQRGVGYSLTGSVRDAAFFIPWGGGRNGKSKLFEALERVTGDYHRNAAVQTFLKKPFAGSGSSDIADLAGARLVTASEPEAGAELNLSLIKQISGGDTLTAARKYGHPFQFKPQLKMWMMTNTKPVIGEDTTAVRERIKLIPFEVTFHPDEARRGAAIEQGGDPAYHRLANGAMGQLLEEAAPAILAWAVQGAYDWYIYGLQDPDKVRAATRGYLDEQNALGGFIEERCVCGKDKRVTSAKLYEAYCTWVEQTHAGRALAQRRFNELLTTHPGYRITGPTKIGGVMTFKGIGLLADETDEAAAVVTAKESEKPDETMSGHAGRRADSYSWSYGDIDDDSEVPF